MLDNVIPHYWVVERLYHIVPWLGRRMHLTKRDDVHKKCGADRLQSASDDVHVNAVRALLEEHRCWTCIALARKVGIALHILQKLNMRKICALWVPHNLKEENMWQRMETARLHYGREGERFLYHNFR